jgi:hypothetical protein
MTKKYSSFKQQQKITESFRTFIGENEPPLKSYGTPRHSRENRLTITPEMKMKNMVDHWASRIKGEINSSPLITGYKGWQGADENAGVLITLHAEAVAAGFENPQVAIKQIKKALESDVKTESKVRFTKTQLHKIIKEEIKKTLSEAEKPKKKPEWMDEYDWETIKAATQEKYDKFFAPIIAQRAKEDEGSAAAGLAKAKKLEQEFLADPKIADLGAKTKVNAGGLWVGLPSRSKPGKVSTDGLQTSDELHSKFIESDWSTTRDITRSGWVRVVKRREEKDWTDPDPHGRYVPGEKAPRLSPWEE